MFGEIPKVPLLELLRFNSYYEQPEGLKYTEIEEEIMDQNYCRFNNRFYKPPKGLAMRSPTSLILAEIFKNDFENRI